MRLNEDNFQEDIQNFTHCFLQEASEEESFSPRAIAIDDKTRIFYEFESLEGHSSKALRAPNPNFHNIKASEVKIPESFRAGKHIWILKPSTMSRGRGIEIFTSLEQLDNFLKMYIDGYKVTDFKNLKYNDKTDKAPSVLQAKRDNKTARKFPKVGSSMRNKKKPKDEQSDDEEEGNEGAVFTSFVIQKYIERPLLYKGYKFDIRVYALLTHDMELYVFREAYVRLSSYKFSLEKLNYYIHLTNNAVQAASKNYGVLEQGNIFPLSELERYAREELGKGKQSRAYQQELPSPRESSTLKQSETLVETTFMEEMKKIIRVTFDSTFDIVNPKGRQHMFEMFGFDFMVDENFKVWLLECNSGPSMTESNQFLKQFLPRVIDDLFKLTVDRVFPPPTPTSSEAKSEPKLPDCPDMFSLMNQHPDINFWELQWQYPRSSQAQKPSQEKS